MTKNAQFFDHATSIRIPTKLEADDDEAEEGMHETEEAVLGPALGGAAGAAIGDALDVNPAVGAGLGAATGALVDDPEEEEIQTVM